MRKIIFAVLLAAVVLLASCSQGVCRRAVEIVIPPHPWEKASGKKLWYTLRWTDSSGLRSLYVGPVQRSISIDVPVGETVIVAAFPLGELNPFGGAVTPSDESGTLTLSQNEGGFANELLSLDREVTKELNYGLLVDNMLKKCNDMRQIGKVSVIRDIQNRQLNDASVKKVSLFGVEQFAVPDGIWTSEYLRDPDLVVSGGTAGPLELPEGVFRYLNTELDRVLVLIVDSRGDRYCYLKQSLV